MSHVTPRISGPDAHANLAALRLKAGSPIYTKVLHVSRSGMQRVIGLYVPHKGRIVGISFEAAALLGWKWDNDRGGVVVDGAGMDMTFHTVYSLSRTLFPKGHRCTGHDGGDGGPRCPSNDHSNDYGTAARIARDELEAEGIDPYAWNTDAERYDLDRLVRERSDLVREREGLTYRKGRMHSDGGYALHNVNLW